ncbi:hypothetical protein IPZ68_14920 [Streptomyces arenae]|nr:hypothetical protein [Streptomyces arenae]
MTEPYDAAEPTTTPAFRPAAPSDLDRLLSLVVPDPACGLTADTHRARLADGQYRHEWTWLAEDPGGGGVPRAVAVWWGGPGAPAPPPSTGCSRIRRWAPAARVPTSPPGC